MRGRVRIGPIKAGNVEVHWPEGSVLLDRNAIDPHSMEPDYNARVRIETVGAESEREPLREVAGGG
jgi:hypothetical protein